MPDRRRRHAIVRVAASVSTETNLVDPGKSNRGTVRTLAISRRVPGCPAPRGIVAAILLALAVAALPGRALGQADPLLSWNDGAAKQAIVKYVADTTRQDAATFVPAAERIATFDNDGTLWAEQPIYFQFAFAIDRVKMLAPKHPEWKEKQPFKSILAGDLKTALAGGDAAMVALLIATHAGMTTDEFTKIVADWLATARHPRFKRPYTECVYQPMIELLGYLRANGFRTFIVSGGGVEFMRVWAERVYGIPPEQVIGSTGVTRFELRAGGPVLFREPKVDQVNDGPGKPVGINRFIGRRPVFSFGNSDGDQQMLEWTAAGGGSRFMGLVHHTDAEREWAYDRTSHIGKLDKALDEARAKGWTVVDMKRDWKRIFPFDEQ
jgi:phosphoserine phosphatase